MITTRPFVHRRRRIAYFAAACLATAGLTASPSCAASRLPVGADKLRSRVGSYEFQVLVDGAAVSTYEAGGETYVLGQMGARYTVRVINHTGQRVEAVASVDGRDAIGGKPADVRTNRGYLVPAWGSVDIEGWRLSQSQVAAFRFSSVPDSYAARTGSAREVGVIGVAIFPERHLTARPLYMPPQEPRFERRRSSNDDEADGLGSLGSSPRSQSKSAESESPAQRAPSAAASPAPPVAASRAPGLDRLESGVKRRRGLGTEFGEAVSSPVRDVDFVRTNATHPAIVLGARYNDRDGLLALGIDVDGCCDGSDDDLALRQRATPFPASDRRRYAAPPPGWQQGCCLRY